MCLAALPIVVVRVVANVNPATMNPTLEESTTTAAVPHLRLRTPEPPSGRPFFTVVAIYDDLPAGLRVKAALARVHHSLASTTRINTFAWSFQQLERLDVRSQAARLAAQAEMILVAAHEGKMLTGHVGQWLESCLAGRQGGLPVLAALDGNACGGLDGLPEERALRQSVRRFAARWRAGFMADEEFEENITPSFALPLMCGQQRGASASQALAMPRNYPLPRHYGIND